MRPDLQDSLREFLAVAKKRTAKERRAQEWAHIAAGTNLVLTVFFEAVNIAVFVYVLRFWYR